MSDKTKILSELSKIIVDAMSTFSGLKKEIETIVKKRVEKVLNNMNLVWREEFEVLRKLASERKNSKNKLKKADRTASRKKRKRRI